MLREIIEETDWATADAFDRMAKCDYLSFVQFIAKAEIVASLKLKKGSRCILDYPVDRYLACIFHNSCTSSTCLRV